MAESAAIPYLSEDEAGSLVTLPMLLRAAERFFSGPERPPLREEAAAGDFRLLTGGEDGLLLTGWLRPGRRRRSSLRRGAGERRTQAAAAPPAPSPAGRPDGPQPPGGQPAVPQAAAPHRLSWVRAGPAPERERL
mgnify:CR=1 FL=1